MESRLGSARLGGQSLRSRPVPDALEAECGEAAGTIAVQQLVLAVVEGLTVPKDWVVVTGPETKVTDAMDSYLGDPQEGWADTIDAKAKGRSR